MISGYLITMSYKLSTNTQAFKKAVFYNMANMQNQLSYKTDDPPRVWPDTWIGFWHVEVC